MDRHDFSKLMAGGCLSILFTAMVFGPMGFGRRYIDQLQQRVRASLDERQLQQVDVSVEHDPVMRRAVILSGAVAAHDRRAALQISQNVPGVSTVRWLDTNRLAGGSPPNFSAQYR